MPSINDLATTREHVDAFHRLLKDEKEGRIGAALVGSIAFARVRRGRDMDAVASANVRRLMLKISRRAKELMVPPIALIETTRTPSTYPLDIEGSQERPPLISLTTIASRLDACEHTIASLRHQSIPAHSINLYVSSEPHMLDIGIAADEPALSRIASMGVNVYACRNVGPYRKQFPILTQLHHANASPETIVVTADDDVLYPTNAIEILVERARAADELVAHRGRRMLSAGNAIAPYSQFEVPIGTSGSLQNLPNGRNGIAFRVGHVPFDPAIFVGPILAPTADDLWLKMVTLARCIPCAVLEPTAMIDPSKDYVDVFPDRKEGLWRAYNASGSNDTSLAALAAYFSTLYSVNVPQIIDDKRMQQ